MFHNANMEQYDSHTLTPHLEAALMLAPHDTIAALQEVDRWKRLKAVSSLAEHLVSRLRGFDIVLTDATKVGELESATDELMLLREQRQDDMPTLIACE
jgi:primosomal protein N''